MGPGIRLAKAHAPVTALGFGTRLGVWFQGCSIGCPGCLSRDTWRAEGPVTPVEDISSWCRSAHPGADGLTISGGEPFQQPEGLLALLRSVRSWADVSFDILVYSGMAFENLRRHHHVALDLIDAVVSGPYVAAAPADDGWRGSTNQRHHPLTDLGRDRDPSSWTGRGQMQVSVSEGSVWFVGIPRRGDLRRLERLARDRGVTLEGASWRP